MSARSAVLLGWVFYVFTMGAESPSEPTRMPRTDAYRWWVDCEDARWAVQMLNVLRLTTECVEETRQ